MHYLYYKTSSILYVKKIERVTWNCIALNGGFRPSDKRGGGGVIHTRIEGGPGLKNFFSALRASVWSKNKRGGGGVIHTRIERGPGLKNVFSALRASVWCKNKREAGPAGPPLDAPLAPCKVIKDTLGFWIPRSKVDSGFQVYWISNCLSVELGFRIFINCYRD